VRRARARARAAASAAAEAPRGARRVPMENYRVNRAVGKGSFGKVYLATHVRENRSYVLKVIKLKGIPPKEREACRNEVMLMQRLQHPNIVAYKDSFFANGRDNLCIVMTYCDGGDLGQRIADAKSHLFKEDQIMHWFVQTALAIHYMHEQKVLHRDIKAQNIFMLGNGRLVLGDLGISKVLDGTAQFAQTQIGTPYYMSPELFKNKPYNHKSDVWALGCVLYELCALVHPFDAANIQGLSQKIMKGAVRALMRWHARSRALRRLFPPPAGATLPPPALPSH
jgi:non-specific serine/threonine protein kinase/NIMA (never in mitosis gene a)-related kinase